MRAFQGFEQSRRLTGCFLHLPSLLASPIRSGSVVNSPALIPTLIFQIERGASREVAKMTNVDV